MYDLNPMQGYASAPAYTARTAVYSERSLYMKSEPPSGEHFKYFNTRNVPRVYDKMKKFDVPLIKLSTAYIPGSSTTVEFIPNNFINPHPQKISTNEEIWDYIEEIFKHMELNMPDITLDICSRNKLKKIKEKLGGRWSEGIQGFCINSPRNWSRHVFIIKSNR